MTLSKAWIIGIAVVLAAAALLGGYGLLEEHSARLKAETASAVQQKTVDQAKADAAATAASLKETLAGLEAQRAKPATPQQIIIDGSKLIPNLPQPVVIQDSRDQGAGVRDQKSPALPDAPKPEQQLVIPAADFQAIHNAEITCQESAAKLNACNLTAADVQTELKATAAERNEWKTAAKGGTWLHRALTAAKWVGIGAAAGYVIKSRD
jgi:hypothetical protein